MLVFIYGFIIILLLCYFKKKKDFMENLIVPPTKLYSLEDTDSNNVCSFNNTPSKNYQTFISISQYLSIKNLTASQDLVGYKICIKLEKRESRSNCSVENSPLSKEITKDESTSSTTPNTEIKDLNIDFGDLDNKAINDDKITDQDYNYICHQDKCWYNATIINHLLLNNLNIHKIGWYNNLLFLETKWIILSEFDIKLPVSRYSKNIKISNENLFYQDTDLLSQQSINPDTSTPNKNIPNCLDPLKKNYLGNLYCNNNKDCYQYGSYICNRGLCENNYLNIQLKNLKS